MTPTPRAAPAAAATRAGSGGRGLRTRASPIRRATPEPRWAVETRFLLGEQHVPTHWYNIIPDMPGPLAPVIHPRTLQPVTPQDTLPLFPPSLLEQEMPSERWIRIPDEVREIYRLWRPSPLHRARRLEAALGTPAHIYYKHEGVSPAGSHKPNTAVPQAFFNKLAGT